MRDALAAIAGRAATLDARWRTGGERPAGLGALIWAARWQEYVAPGDDAGFTRRLAWDGWRPDALGWLTVEPAEPPAWVDLLAEALAPPSGHGDPAGAAGPDPALAEVPFGAALAPFVSAAWARLAAAGPTARLSPAAAAALRRAWASRLARLAGPAIEAELPALPDAAGWLARFERLPVLARLFGTALLQAIATTRELLDRLAADAAAIEAAFGFPVAEVAGVESFMSDPHHGGRSVMRLTFAGGHALMYKPRALAVDVGFAGLLAWLAGQGLEPAPRVPRTLDRGAWGWAEVVAPAPCPDLAAARRFFRRAGALAAAVYALDGTDFHAENVIAAGEHPMLVDLEVVLQPGHVPDDDFTPFADVAALHRQLGASVLHSSLVAWPVKEDGRWLDMGGLSDPPPFPVRVPVWRDVGRPGMHRAWAEVAAERHNLPLLDGRPASARDHVDDLVAGFTAAYDLLLAHRDALVAPGGPLAAFHGLPMRYLYRTTRHYGRFLDAGLAPDRLSHGLERSYGLDRLTRTYVRAAERPAAWPLIAAERRALDDLDIPCFVMGTADDALVVDGERVPCFVAAPYARAAARVARLDPADRAFQAGLIRLAVAREVVAPAAGRAPAGFLDAAGAIAATLAARAIPLADGGVGWVGLLTDPGEGRWVPAALGPGLARGVLGPALFLAAYGRAAGDAAATDLARRAAGTAVRALAADAAAVRERAGVGGADGLAAIAYALGKLAAWLDAPDLAAGAAAAVAAIRPEDVAACAEADMVGGLAGAIAALVAVARDAAGAEPVRPAAAARAAAALGLARLAGERLAALPLPAPTPAGQPPDGRVQTGYAHGAAGVGAALAALARATGAAPHVPGEPARAPGEPAFATAAARAFAAEAPAFDAARAGWATQPPVAGDEPMWRMAWCHGAPGGLLARLDLPPAVPADVPLSAVAAAVAAAPASAVDWPCCGTFGRTEVLLEAARTLGDPSLAEAARALGHAALAGRAWPPSDRHAPDLDLSFHRGLAGIGYALLRLADPSLPCVLAWR